MTEGNTTRTLHDESWNKIINLLRNPDGAQRNPTMDAIASTIEAQGKSSKEAVALCGLPGAGKSKVAERLTQVYDAPGISMGDAIRHEYKEQNWMGKHRSEVPDEIPSEKLGDFAAQWRDDDAEAIPGKITEMVEELYPNEDLIIIDGVRSTTDYMVLKDYFKELHLVEIQADFYTRLERLVARARDGEEAFTAVDLAERDENERNNLGFEALKVSEYIDLEMANNSGVETLTINLSDLVENDLPYDIADGRPLGLDEELEQWRRQQRA